MRFFYVIETFMNRQSILKEFLKKQKADLKSKLAEFIWIFKPIFGLQKNWLISPALGCSSMLISRKSKPPSDLKSDIEFKSLRLK